MRQEEPSKSKTATSREDTPAPYSLVKIHERKKSGTEVESLYLATNELTGERALYSALHNTQSKPDNIGEVRYKEKPGSMSQINWRKQRYASGVTSIVKPLTKLSIPHPDGSIAAIFAESLELTEENSTLPNAIALKCYTAPGDTSKLVNFDDAKYAASIEQQRGNFAVALMNNDKPFYASEWIDGKELFDVLVSPTGVRPTPTAPQLLLLFQRYIKEVTDIHEITGLPLVDLKPANILAKMAHNEIRGLHPIDYACRKPGSAFTRSYLSTTDIDAIQSHPMKKYKPSFASDFRSLSIVFAASVSKLMPGKYLGFDQVRTRGISHYKGTYTNKVGGRWGPKDEFQLAVQGIFTTLAEGENPFKAPGDDLLKVQLQNDLDMIKGYLQATLDRFPPKPKVSTPLTKCLEFFHATFAKYMALADRISTSLNREDDLCSVKAELVELSRKVATSREVATRFPDIESLIKQNCFYAEDYLSPTSDQAEPKPEARAEAGAGSY